MVQCMLALIGLVEFGHFKTCKGGISKWREESRQVLLAIEERKGGRKICRRERRNMGNNVYLLGWRQHGRVSARSGFQTH